MPSNIAGGEYRLRLPAPTVSPAEGTYSSAPRPTITHSTSGVTLRYTLDRHEPTESSPVVPTSCCIPITNYTTLKVAAFKAGWAQSRTVTNTYLVGSQTIPISNTVFNRIEPAGDTARTSDPLRLAVSGTPVVPDTMRVVRNGTDVTASAVITASSIFVPSLIVAGENDIELFGVDVAGIGVGASYSIFGAATEISVAVRSQANAPLAGAAVLLFDRGQDWPVQTLTADAGGVARALVPSGFSGRVVVLAPGYHTIDASITGSTTLLLEPRNENFERGAEDWSLSFTGDAFFIAHTEGLLPWVVGRPRDPGIAFDGSGNDIDLLVGTWGSPPGLTISRTIQVEPGVSTVQLRYRFAANHADSVYRLALSVPGTGIRVEHSYSARELQALGLAVPNYYRDIQSYWLTLSVMLPPGSQDVRVEGILPPDPNYGHTSTWFLIDQVAATGIQMEPAQLEEWTRERSGVVRKHSLQFLSLGPKGADSGVTQVNGMLAFNANPNGAKRVSSVRLEVSRERNGSSLLSVPLRSDVASSIVNQPFGETGRLSTGTTRELFTISASQMAQFSRDTEEELFLAVTALDESGREIRQIGEAERRVIKVTDILPDVQRYGDRDPNECLGTTWKCYGDAWARPAFHRITRAAQRALTVAVPGQREAIAITYNDFSNSNGGYFPHHTFHNEGRHVDGWVDGYRTRDTALAAKMAHIARAIHAAMVADGNTFRSFQILVAFDPRNPNDPFTAALMAEPRLGGRDLLSYFIDGGAAHRGHFHVQMY